MEGLIGNIGPGEVTTLPSRREERLVHKWLAFLFISLLFIVTLGYFAAAAFGV